MPSYNELISYAKRFEESKNDEEPMTSKDWSLECTETVELYVFIFLYFLKVLFF